MSQLDPNLKRLLKWSRAAEVSALEEVPFGFSSRVVASTIRSQVTTLLQELHQRAWRIACASLALLICGAVVLVSQRSLATPEPEISSALNFVANNLLK